MPGADDPEAFASKLGRGEVKAWPRGESHSPPISFPTRALFNFLFDIDRSTVARRESAQYTPSFMTAFTGTQAITSE